MVRFLILLLFTLLLAAIGFIITANKQQEADNLQLIQSVWRQGGEKLSGRYHSERLQRLPAPVQRYLSTVLPPEAPLVKRIRVHQHGTFNIGDTDPQWLPFKATSHITTTPPGMVWDAHISIVPPLSIHVIDYYVGGKGGLYGKLLDAVPIVNAEPAPVLDQGELMTWLAEAVWYPTALLPGNGVSWEALDERRARATVDDGLQQVSLDFHFNERHEVVRVSSSSRGREVNGTYQMLPWSCHYRDYGKMNGVLVPLEGEVSWSLPTGEQPYMRARIDKLEYDPPI